jgi:transposase-like protein
MATPRSTRNPLFLGRWFDDEIVILCVRWYVSYKLSYRDISEMMADRGLAISHTIIMRWTVRYAAEFERKWRAYKKPVGSSWRVDELFVKVKTGWKYLYRAVDQHGQTVDFFFSATRGVPAAKAFFRKAVRANGDPHSITLDGHEPSHRAVARLQMCGDLPRFGLRVRCSQYMNNVLEQDHRRIRQRLNPMHQFQRFHHARRVIAGIELAAQIRKEQYDFSRLACVPPRSNADKWALVMTA